ncbi:MAG: aldo/keto reductase [Gammaproteobacteria bacterium]
MKYNRLGQSEIRVSELGLDCQSLGGGLYYRNKAESIAMVHKALDEGVNFFDTSDHYSLGLSEQWLGTTLKGRRQDVVLATKAGTRYTLLGNLASRIRPALRSFSNHLRPLKVFFHRGRAAQKRQDFSPAYLTRAVEASLKRMNTDYLDLFQLHKPSASVLHSGDWLDTPERLQTQGKIRSYGISCATVSDAMLCLDMRGIVSVQVGMSLLDMEAIPIFLEQAQQRSLSIIVRNPRAQGHLTSELSDIMAETYAKNNAEVVDKTRRARQFAFLANEHRTLAQAALQFVLQLPGVTTAIPRAVNMQQLLDNLGALVAPSLLAPDIDRIMNASQINKAGGV